MKFWNKIKRDIKARNEASRQEQIKQKFGMASLAHQCMRCKHFVYREEKPRNWVCRCPDERLTFRGTTCFGFEPGEHPEMVVMHTR